MAKEGLFPEHLIPASVSSLLPSGYKIRPLQKSDYREFLDVLRVLAIVGDISKDDFDQRYDWMRSQDGYYILVVECSSSNGPGVVVGTGSLIVEKKLYVWIF